MTSSFCEHGSSYKLPSTLCEDTLFTNVSGCSCRDGCKGDALCECVDRSIDGMVFECGKFCKCNKEVCGRMEGQHVLSSSRGVSFGLDTSCSDSLVKAMRKWENKHLEVAHISNDKGYGAIAKRPIAKGTLVAVYVGELIRLEEAQRRLHHQKQFACDATAPNVTLKKSEGNYIIVIREHIQPPSPKTLDVNTDKDLPQHVDNFAGVMKEAKGVKAKMKVKVEERGEEEEGEELAPVGVFDGNNRDCEGSDAPRKKAKVRNIQQPLRPSSTTTVMNTCVDARHFGNVSRFINHSCSPNLRCGIRRWHMLPHVVFIAVKDIDKGEEVCFDYARMGNTEHERGSSSTYNSGTSSSSSLAHDLNSQSSTPCLCNSSQCRKFLPLTCL
eukprot:m.57403 g.57403  ORF g.57403 m.57403 type:complete len:384 (+) comp11228_c0_seq3:118-1269(+)